MEFEDGPKRIKMSQTPWMWDDHPRSWTQETIRLLNTQRVERVDFPYDQAIDPITKLKLPKNTTKPYTDSKA